MSEKVVLKVGGQAFAGWETVSASRSLNTLCADFHLTLYDDNPGRTDRSVITDDAACELWLGDELFITGFIEAIEHVMAPGSHGISVSGRDRTGDLLDCSAEHASGSWKGQSLEAIAGDLVKPYGIKIKVTGDTKPVFAVFALEHGESVFEALVRLCKMRGLLVTTNAAAELVIFSPTDDRQRVPAFVLGRDMEGIRFRSTSAQRYSSYTVKGQHNGVNVAAKDAAGPKGTATDPDVKRHRPLIIISNEQATAGALETRAQWEAASRAGNSKEVSFTVMGWRDGAGALLRPNVITHVSASYIGLDRDMMVRDVSFELGRSTTASLTLVSPEAFTTEDIIEAKKKKGKKARHSLDWAGALGDG